MSNSKISLRRIHTADCDFLYRLQVMPGARLYSINPSIPTFEEHQEWFQQSLHSHNRQTYIIVVDDCSAGTIRLEHRNDSLYEISIVVHTDFAGRGVAKQAIQLLLHQQEPYRRTILARVHHMNTNSIRLFQSCGFLPSPTDDPAFHHFLWSNETEQEVPHVE